MCPISCESRVAPVLWGIYTAAGNGLWCRYALLFCHCSSVRSSAPSWGEGSTRQAPADFWLLCTASPAHSLFTVLNFLLPCSQPRRCSDTSALICFESGKGNLSSIHPAHNSHSVQSCKSLPMGSLLILSSESHGAREQRNCPPTDEDKNHPSFKLSQVIYFCFSIFWPEKYNTVFTAINGRSSAVLT